MVSQRRINLSAASGDRQTNDAYWIVCSTSLTDGTGSPARSMRSTASVNRGTFAVCRSLPVCTQLRTWRCTAITNAMCEEEKCDLTARRSAIEGFYLPQVF